MITPPSPTSTLDVTGNWQIQTGPATQTSQAILLVGSLSGSGSNITGTFRLTDLAQSTACPALNQVITVKGSVDSTRTLTLTSAAFLNNSVFTATLAIPASLTTVASGTLQVTGGGCVYSSSAAIGGQIAPVTGTYIGTLTPISGYPTTPTANASASVTLVQSASPAVDGQFPLVGTLQVTTGTCTISSPVTGTASGVGVMLAAPTASGAALTAIQANGAVNNTATQFASLGFLFYPAPCGTAGSLSTAQYSGPLIRQ